MITRLAYIEFNSIINRFYLYSSVDKNNRVYLHSVKETLGEVLTIGIETFDEVFYDNRIYTDRVFKLKKITNRLKDEIR